jgi:hypothetical protein
MQPMAAAPAREATRVEPPPPGDSRGWLLYFRRNRERTSPPVPARIDDLPPSLREPLVRSLQRFQLGEAGPGTVAKQARESGDPALDDALVDCVALYVAEEGRHAREIAAVLRALGAGTLRRAWSEKLFERARRALGLRQKMLVIAVAEVVGVVFYGAVRDRIPSRPVATVAGVIAADESAHLDFQADYFGRVLRAASPRRRTLLGAALAADFAAGLAGAVATVAIDHRPLLRAIDLSTGELALRCAAEAFIRLPRLRDAYHSETTSRRSS